MSPAVAAVRVQAAPQPADGPATAAVRLVAGFAAFGAGSVDLAISSSFFAGGAGMPGFPVYAAGALWGLWGATLIVAAVACLARGRTPAGSAAVVLPAAAALHVAAIVFSTAETSALNLSHLAALLLTLMIVAAVAWLRRNSARYRPADPAAAAGAAGTPGRLLLAAFAGAVLVAGIATPGLAASTAGQYAVPHGGHGTATVPGGHHQR